MAEATERVCPCCHKLFAQVDARQMWCSPLCWRRFTYVTQLFYRDCAACGSLFTAHGQQTSRRYCSPKCLKQASLAQNRQRWRDNYENAKRLARKNSALRRARKRGLPTEEFTHEQVFDRDKWRCHLCRKRINPKLRRPHPLAATLDHVIPLSLGGPHTLANVAASHAFCNTAKHDRPQGEQLRLLG